MHIKKFFVLVINLLLVSFIAGCGSDPEDDLPTDSTKGITGSSNYIVNSATTFQEIAAISGIVMKATTAGGSESIGGFAIEKNNSCLLYTSPSPRDRYISRMPSSA